MIITGKCIRCKAKNPSIVLIYNNEIAYHLNLCQKCLLNTTPGIKKLKKNGDAIWLSNIDTPKTLYYNLKKASLDENREKNIIKRSIKARICTQNESKNRRNIDRTYIIKDKASKYNIYIGTHISWGDSKIFDEYYGEINENNQPHGYGIKFYSNKSIYIGGWRDGIQHNSDNRISKYMSSVAEYSGSFKYGLKHGKGM